MTQSRGEHIISLENISVGYGGEEALLHEINLSVNQGEMVAVLGRNGSGKSTLLKSLIGLQPCLEGACYLGNDTVQSYSPRRRAQRVSYVSSLLTQFPSISVRELVSLGRMPYTGWTGRMDESDRRIIDRALREVRLNSFENRKLDQLSDGERQRAMIARAFVQDTPLMVLDEPTAFLDIPNKYELVRLLTRFRDGGRSVIYSTHDLETAMICADKLWVIHGGRIAEGAPEDLGISGIFNTLFQNTGIAFDEEHHRFKYTEAAKGIIQLKGEPGNVLNWTRSALQRMGFEISDEGDSILSLTQNKGGAVWELWQRGEKRTFPNIYSLARFLKKVK